MINGFKEQTEQLRQREYQLIPIFVKGFENRIGKKNAITNADIIWNLEKQDIRIKPARVRKIINHIRVNGIVKRLVAYSKGYYIEDDDLKFNQYIESLQYRAKSINFVAEQLKKQI